MARLYLRKTANDAFTTLSSGQVLTTDPLWKVLIAGGDWYEHASLNKVYSSGGVVRYYHTYTPVAANYGCLVKYAGRGATTANLLFGPMVRLNTPGASCNGYYARWSYVYSTGVWTIGIARILGGTAGVLKASDPVSAPSVGDTLRLEATAGAGGSVDLVCYINESDTPALSWNDADGNQITATGNAGMYGNAADSVYCSQWSCYEALLPPTNVAVTDGTWKNKNVVTWTKDPAATGNNVYRFTSNTPASGVLIATLGDVSTYTDYPPQSGTGNVYWYWVTSTVTAPYAAESAKSTGNDGYRAISGTPCPDAAVTDLGDHLSVTLDNQNNVATSTGDGDAGLTRAAGDLLGINVIRTGTLTYDDETATAAPPLLIVRLWGNLV